MGFHHRSQSNKGELESKHRHPLDGGMRQGGPGVSEADYGPQGDSQADTSVKQHDSSYL